MVAAGLGNSAWNAFTNDMFWPRSGMYAARCRSMKSVPGWNDPRPASKPCWPIAGRRAWIPGPTAREHRTAGRRTCGVAPEYRRVLLLRNMECLSFREIAQQMERAGRGASADAVAPHRTDLRQRLSERGLMSAALLTATVGQPTSSIDERELLEILDGVVERLHAGETVDVDE